MTRPHKTVDEWTFFEDWREYMVLSIPIINMSALVWTLLLALLAGWDQAKLGGIGVFVGWLLGSPVFVALARRRRRS